MTNQELTDRYVYAVTKNLPRKSREDVSRELHSLISDMLEERCGALTPTERDLRVILAELGMPEELSEKYSPTKDKALIGPPYFGKYIFVLKIVLLCTGFGILLASLLELLVSGADNGFLFAIQHVSIFLQSLLAAFGFVTLLFAFFQWKGVSLHLQSDSLNDLPPVPQKKSEISRSECIVGIVFSVLFTTIFLGFPGAFGVFIEKSGEHISIFLPEAVHSKWYLILGFAVLGIGRECVKLLEGRYTFRVLGATAIADIFSGVLAVFWLANDQILNPAFFAKISRLFADDSAFITDIFTHFHYFFLGCMLFALTLDLLVTTVKTLCAREK
ncbi:MAG: hypothetical protein HFG44_04560 [Oscillospiraceae bacterium]|nr:hypothetical protein [Oscillospiraceae bacterium]